MSSMSVSSTKFELFVYRLLSRVESELIENGDFAHFCKSVCSGS